jgi:hypothetical protein
VTPRVVLELTARPTPISSEVFKGIWHEVLFRWYPCWTSPINLQLKRHFRIALIPSHVKLLYIKEAETTSKMFLNQLRSWSPTSHFTNFLAVWSKWISSHPIWVLLKLNVTTLMKPCLSNHKRIGPTNTITNVRPQPTKSKDLGRWLQTVRDRFKCQLLSHDDLSFLTQHGNFNCHHIKTHTPAYGMLGHSPVYFRPSRPCRIIMVKNGSFGHWFLGTNEVTFFRLNLSLVHASQDSFWCQHTLWFMSFPSWKGEPKSCW